MRKIIVLIQLVFLLLLFILVLVMIPAKAFAHVGGLARESLILSKYFKGNIALIIDPESQQWKQSFEKHIQSLWGHEISIRTLNNGTYIFFLLSWPAKEKTAGGAAIMFETPNDIWYWSTAAAAKATAAAAKATATEKEAIGVSHNEGVITKAQWNNENWNVIFGRQVQPKNENQSTAVSFHTAVREEGFIKFVVWDGSKGESFTQVNDEALLHSDFILLPEINVYPKDVYVWAGMLAAGGLLSLFVEQRLYKKQQQNQPTEKGGASLVGEI